MLIDIKRKVELWLCDRLRLAVPGEKFYPRKGGDETTDAAEIVPPFVVVESLDATRAMPEEPTWTVPVTITRYSHFADTKTPEHSHAVRQLVDAIANLPRGDFPERAIRIHGTYHSSSPEGSANDEETVYADAMSITVGCTG